MPVVKVEGFYTPSPYSQPTCTPAAPQHWVHPISDAPLFSPDINVSVDLNTNLNNAILHSSSMSEWTSDQLFEEAESNALSFDLNDNVNDVLESNTNQGDEDIRRNPHCGARDRHWRCGT
ncbi:unnamed protein product [Lupinus luteus]|uniref:Uncharacterized protein n=1 Tax=Lupinus luteus TaxID=3873 RepID=A0AAV1VQR3_LUPLU